MCTHWKIRERKHICKLPRYQPLPWTCSSVRAAEGIVQWPSVIKNIVKWQAVARSSCCCEQRQTRQTAGSRTHQLLPKQANKQFPWGSGWYLEKLQGKLHLKLVTGSLRCTSPLACSQVEGETKIHLNAAYARGFFKAIILSNTVWSITYKSSSDF